MDVGSKLNFLHIGAVRSSLHKTWSKLRKVHVTQIYPFVTKTKNNQNTSEHTISVYGDCFKKLFGFVMYVISFSD